MRSKSVAMRFPSLQKVFHNGSKRNNDPAYSRRGTRAKGKHYQAAVKYTYRVRVYGQGSTTHVATVQYLDE